MRNCCYFSFKSEAVGLFKKPKLLLISIALAAGSFLSPTVNSQEQTDTIYSSLNGPPTSSHCNVLFNGSFEDFVQLPNPSNYHENIDLSVNWLKPTNSGNSGDYFHTLSSDPRAFIPSNFYGNQNAFEGFDDDNAYTGIYTLSGTGNNHRDWIIGTLNGALKAGHRYKVIMYVSLSENFHSSCKPPGIKFTKLPLSNSSSSDIINMNADIESQEIVSSTTDWIKVIGEYVANGTEKYISVANFRTENESIHPQQIGSNNVSYFYLDEIAVIDMGECCINPLVIPDGSNISALKNSPTFDRFIINNTLETD